MKKNILILLLGILITFTPATITADNNNYCDIPYGSICTELDARYPQLTVEQFCNRLDNNPPPKAANIGKYICNNPSSSYNPGEKISNVCFDLAETEDCTNTLNKRECTSLGGEWHRTQEECLTQTDPLCCGIEGNERIVATRCLNTCRRNTNTYGINGYCIIRCMRNTIKLCDTPCEGFCENLCNQVPTPGCYNKCHKLLCKGCCVPEFPTQAAALTILLTTPALAYLLVKKRE